jgi:hypothetical protein
MQPRLDVQGAEVVHGRVEREPGGDVRGAADEVRGGGVGRGGDAGAVGFAPEGRGAYWGEVGLK